MLKLMKIKIDSGTRKLCQCKDKIHLFLELHMVSAARSWDIFSNTELNVKEDEGNTPLPLAARRGDTIAVH